MMMSSHGFGGQRYAVDVGVLCMCPRGHNKESVDVQWRERLSAVWDPYGAHMPCLAAFASLHVAVSAWAAVNVGCCYCCSLLLLMVVATIATDSAIHFCCWVCLLVLVLWCTDQAKFNMAKAWDDRCRKWYGDRYDFRTNMVSLICLKQLQPCRQQTH